MEQSVLIKRWYTIANAEDSLRSTGLSKKTLTVHKKRWDCLREFCVKNVVNCDFGNIESLEHAIAQYIINFEGDDTQMRKFNHSFSLLKEYVISGTIKSMRQTYDFSGEIGLNVLEYIREKETEHIRPASLFTYRMQLSRLVDFLRNIHVESLDALRNEHIFMYISQLRSGFKSDTYLAISFAKRFLKWLYSNRRISTNISVKIPSGKFVQQPNIPSVYTTDEIEKLLASFDRSNPVGKRDYVAAMLGARLGMRASDITNLKFSSLLWEESTIKFNQIKTGHEVELPLLPEVGNAIIDYLKYGRPESSSPIVLLSAKPPYGALDTACMYHIISQGFKRAGIDTSKRHHGTHALRHSLASRMLEGHTSMPVISETLGHTSTDSTMFYLRVDITSLSVCPLGIEPIAESFYEQFKWR